MRMLWIAVGTWTLGLSAVAWAGSAGVALVYRGPGACEERCSESAARVAELAGFHVRYVGPDESDPSVFRDAAVWIQPGGESVVVAKTMSPGLEAGIREFVAGGGAYVGFCAGGFFATEWNWNREVRGLGILPGRNALYHEGEGGELLVLDWRGTRRQLYWEGGPYFLPPAQSGVEVTATYPDGKAASVRARHGAGKVYVTGLHPEAPQSWRDYFHLVDADGLDEDLAVEMIRWATTRD